MVGLEYAPIYTNELVRGSFLDMKKKYKNDGRMFCVLLKIKCFESVYGYIVTDDDIIESLARDLGVPKKKFLEMVTYACVEAGDFGLDKNNNPMKIPFLDFDLWKEHRIICCREWLAEIIAKNDRSEKGKARNRRNKRAQRERERLEEEKEDDTIYGES